MSQAGRTEEISQAKLRWDQVALLQEHYREFKTFLHDVMQELGFRTSDVQEDIGNWMAYGPRLLAVFAQRGQAKTTIAAAFAVWCLIHAPAFRVLIVSAGGTQAGEISTLIVRLIMRMEVLECLRPDRMAGDRSSVEAFDIHHSLKGTEKSPSVACVGIESNLPGKRADLVLADDVESPKNATTAGQRAKLWQLTREFSSICSSGRILWLGTPQTNDSIYNGLAARGVAIRVWPGRYPTAKQMAWYGDRLAPLITQRISRDYSLQLGGGVLGDQGQPVDPLLMDEAKLQEKELDQGTPHFQLQFMLNTELTDALKYPLKTEQLVVLSATPNRVPLVVTRGMSSSHVREFVVGDFAFKMMEPHELSRDTMPMATTWATIDPAAGGKNADETGYAIGGFANGNVYLLAVGGVPGGYDEHKLEELARVLARFKLDGVTIEKNMGYGAFKHVFQPVLRKHMSCSIEDDLVTGQKEKRIISTLAPVVGRGALIITPSAIEEDRETCQRHAPSSRTAYSFFHQFAKITSESGALVHDDRLDAVEALVRRFQEALAVDQRKSTEAAQRRAHEEAMRDPLGYGRKAPQAAPNVLSRLLRRY